MVLTEMRSCKCARGVNSVKDAMQLKETSRKRSLLKTWIPVDMISKTTVIRFIIFTSHKGNDIDFHLNIKNCWRLTNYVYTTTNKITILSLHFNQVCADIGLGSQGVCVKVQVGCHENWKVGHSIHWRF